HGDIDVLHVGVTGQRHVEHWVGALRRLSQDLALGGRGDFPLAHLAAESFGDRVHLVILERPGLLRVVTGKQGEAEGPDDQYAGSELVQGLHLTHSCTQRFSGTQKLDRKEMQPPGARLEPRSLLAAPNRIRGARRSGPTRDNFRLLNRLAARAAPLLVLRL